MNWTSGSKKTVKRCSDFHRHTMNSCQNRSFHLSASHKPMSSRKLSGND
uniref:Transmembrane protein 154 n=2 Tax=Nothobranchius TaxID=28779 RepID=A0A1A8P0I0_9TELE